MEDRHIIEKGDKPRLPDVPEHPQLAVVGIDRFDEFNDRWGREKGDLALETFWVWLSEKLPNAVVRPWVGARSILEVPATDVGRIEPLIPAFAAALLETTGIPNSLTFSGALTSIGNDTRDDATERASRGLGRARRAGGARILHLDDIGAERGTVLFAEDDELTALLVTRLLEQEGFEVRHFSDGVAALRWAETANACLIVADVLMPHMDGFELVQALRAIPRHLHTPIVLLTSMNREADVLRGFSVGADDYIQKPFSPRELKARLLKWAPVPDEGFEREL